MSTFKWTNFGEAYIGITDFFYSMILYYIFVKTSQTLYSYVRHVRNFEFNRVKNRVKNKSNSTSKVYELFPNPLGTSEVRITVL